MNCMVVNHDELFRLLEGYCRGALPPDEFSHLAGLLRVDASARRFYIEYMDLHTALQWEQSANRDLPELSEDQFGPLPGTDYRRPVLGFLGDAAHWTHDYFSQPGPLSILAAAIFMVCLISILNILPAPTYEPSRSNHVCTTTTSGTGFQPVKKEGKLNFVARITGLHNCRWAADGRAPYGFDHMTVGRELKLDAGLVEITYYNGAKVVLEGPVEFTVEQANACRLDIGKLTAKVSKSAVGFTVETPDMSIVDLGTEFGVEIDDDGIAAVHVFIGRVEAELVAQNGAAPKKVQISQGQAVRFDRQQQTIDRVTADHGRFVRNVRMPEAGALAWADVLSLSGPITHYTFDDPENLGKNSGLGADGVVQNGVTAAPGRPGHGTAADFGTDDTRQIEVAAVDTRAFSPGGAGGTGITVAAWVKTTYTAGRSNIFFSYDATDEDAGTNRDELLLELREGVPNAFVRDKFAYDPGSHEIDLYHESIADGNWHHVALTLSAGDNKTLRLYVDGVLSTEGQSIEIDNINLRCSRVGRRLLGDDFDYDHHGLIDDLVIFRRAFSAEEIEQWHKTGKLTKEP